MLRAPIAKSAQPAPRRVSRRSLSPSTIAKRAPNATRVPQLRLISGIVRPLSWMLISFSLESEEASDVTSETISHTGGLSISPINTN